MTSQKLITVVVFALILGLSAIDVDAGALDAAKIGASLNSEAPESSSEIANSTVSEEKVIIHNSYFVVSGSFDIDNA